MGQKVQQQIEYYGFYDYFSSLQQWWYMWCYSCCCCVQQMGFQVEIGLQILFKGCCVCFVWGSCTHYCCKGWIKILFARNGSAVRIVSVLFHLWWLNDNTCCCSWFDCGCCDRIVKQQLVYILEQLIIVIVVLVNWYCSFWGLDGFTVIKAADWFLLLLLVYGFLATKW